MRFNIKRITNILKYKILEKKRGGVKYLFVKGKRKTDELVIIFSGFSSTNVRTYNYINCMNKSKTDRLYILDSWGFKGSYYLYENGKKYPEEYTSNLITGFLSKGYKKVYMAGSSKGGTCALYYGIKHRVDEIISGACQYNLGTYLSKFPQIFEAMMGKRLNSVDISNLNNILPDILEQNAGVDTNIILLYSTKEITYETETVDLLKKLKDCTYNINEIVFDFPEHEMIGPVFADYLSNKFCINSN